jgi:hypothetical protein
MTLYQGTFESFGEHVTLYRGTCSPLVSRTLYQRACDPLVSMTLYQETRSPLVGMTLYQGVYLQCEAA